MTARDLTLALGGRWHGRYGTAKCPAHDDRSPSLTIRDGDRAPLLRCHAGCQQGDIIAELRRIGLWHRGPDRTAEDLAELARRRREREESDRAAAEKRTLWARRIWSRARPAAGTVVEVYLRSRGITIEIPASIRVATIKHGPSGLVLPTMVAAIVGADNQVVAVHRTWLRDDGGGKAPVEPDRMVLGPMRGGAIRLAPGAPRMALAEGVETALSIIQATGIATWAAVAAGNLPAVPLPPLAREILIAADHDEAGIKYARLAASRWLHRGRRARVVLAPGAGTDFNDHLAEAAA